MKNNLPDDKLLDFYKEISFGNEDAFAFVKLWTLYCHKFDDIIDEDFSVVDLIETNNELTKLLTCKFFTDYSSLLLPQIYLSAESYQASETSKKDNFLGVYLSHEGNNLLRLVALITGGYNHLVKMSEKIRELTYVEHPIEEIK